MKSTIRTSAYVCKGSEILNKLLIADTKGRLAMSNSVPDKEYYKNIIYHLELLSLERELSCDK
jgi:hypothetical protein